MEETDWRLLLEDPAVLAALLFGTEEPPDQLGPTAKYLGASWVFDRHGFLWLRVRWVAASGPGYSIVDHRDFYVRELLYEHAAGG